MIFRHQVKDETERYLDLLLADQKSILREIKRQPDFDKWIDRLTHRCNELDTIGWVPSKWAMYDFIQKANIHYANKVLDRLQSKIDAVQSVQGTNSST